MAHQYSYNRALVGHARSGRKDSTDAERLLWQRLRNRQLGGYKFRRQYPIKNYILDFYCVEKQLVIELDGSQHISRKYYDSKRTVELEVLGIHVIRFWNNDVLQNIDGVLEQILIALEKQSDLTPALS